MMYDLSIWAALSSLALVGAGKTELPGRSDYTVWCKGNCDHDKVTTSTPGAVLMGGGTDTNEAFAWQISNANGGDFVVMRASGDDAYNDYIYEMSIATDNRLNSVRTILFNNEKASAEPEVLDIIKNAEAIFFAGGDQNDYMTYWAGTEVQSIIQSKLGNVTIGGTSAGLAVLGGWVYTAEDGTVYSDEALEDPYNKYMDFAPALFNIPFMDTVITDTHFVTRDRMGRMLAFVARKLADNEDVAVFRGVGVDEHTALLLDVQTGGVRAVGVGTAYVCTSSSAPEVCSSKTPLTFTGIDCVRLSGPSEDVFSFASWSGGGVAYTSDIKAGHFTTLPYGPSFE